MKKWLILFKVMRYLKISSRMTNLTKLSQTRAQKHTLKAIVSKALLEREIGQTPYYLKDEGLKAHAECDSAKSTI
jgi:flagellar motor component MotA